MTMFTIHARSRVLERLGLAERHAADCLLRLWNAARLAEPGDFLAFGAGEYPDREYRVSVDGQWMLVRSTLTGKFMTLLKRP